MIEVGQINFLVYVLSVKLVLGGNFLGDSFLGDSFLSDNFLGDNFLASIPRC